MATHYSDRQITAMAEEFDHVAHSLGISLSATPGELVNEILDRSASWCSVSGCRALGPFAAFIAGATDSAPRDEAEDFGSGPRSFALVEALITTLPRE